MNEKIKILYVDDEEPNLYLFKYNFSKYFEVFTANRGSEALEVLNEQHDIKVVISDMKMPLMSGIEFIKKAQETYSSTKYFLLTGFDINEEIKDALNKQLILKCFKKPFNKVEIQTTIQSAVVNN